MADLKYYEEENQRHPKLCVKCDSVVKADLLMYNILNHFNLPKKLKIKFHNMGYCSTFVPPNKIRLNISHMKWLTIVHEIAHYATYIMKSKEYNWKYYRWHGRHHAYWVNKIAQYIYDNDLITNL